MSKHFKYSITFHNVRPGSKAHIQNAFRALPKFKAEVSAEEPYEQADRPDRHVHLFVEFYNQRHFNSILKISQRIGKPYIYPEQLFPGEWGRVHVEKGRGSMTECLNYLEGGTKEKGLDPEVLEVHQAPPPGHYYCYKCKNYKRPMDCRFTHPSGEGVCFRCWAIHNEEPGEWVYDPSTERMWYRIFLPQK